VYYFRTNYLILFLGSFALLFVRNPLALLAIAVCTFAGLCLNDPFAIGFGCAAVAMSGSAVVSGNELRAQVTDCLVRWNWHAQAGCPHLL
jgi:hypothetical protein